MQYPQTEQQTNFLHSENGSVTFISLVMVLIMAILIGFVGNMANETIERQKLQNAADATAYSSAVWMARGMNTISTLNHIMGELTALIVIIEAIGGPEAEGNGFSSLAPRLKDEFAFNAALEAGRFAAPEMFNLASDIPRVLQFVHLLVTSHPTHQCGAALYDAEVNLKMHGAICLAGKMIGNVLEGLFWVPIIGPAFLAMGQVLHVVMNIYMAVVEVETHFIRGLEKIVPPLAAVKKPLRILIGGMSQLAGTVPRQFHPGQDAYSFHSLQDKGALQRNAGYFKDQYFLAHVSYWANSLPVMTEPWINQRGNGTAYDADHSWKGDAIFGGFTSEIRSIAKAARSLTSWLPWWMGNRKKRIRKSIDRALNTFNRDSKNLGNLGWIDNPSIEKLHHLDAVYEQKTQWVRGTYPYVDMYRQPFRNLFAPLVLSELKSYFTAWTYRYTLNESFYLHRDMNCRMQVMTGTDYGKKGADKGNESWTNSAFEAEEMFSVIVAVESHPQPAMFSQSYFKKANEQGNVAFAQAMYYNLNGRESNVSSSLSSKAKTLLQPNTGWDTLQWGPIKNGHIMAIEDGGVIQAREWKSCDPYGGGNTGLTTQYSNLIANAKRQSQNEVSPEDFENDIQQGISGLMPSTKLTSLFVMNAPDRAYVQLNWQAMLRPIGADSLARLRDASRGGADGSGCIKSMSDFMHQQESGGGSFLTH